MSCVAVVLLTERRHKTHRIYIQNEVHVKMHFSLDRTFDRKHVTLGKNIFVMKTYSIRRARNYTQIRIPYGAVVRTQFRPRGGRTMTQFGRRQVTAGQGVTSQYDRKVVYRKKSMPRRKRRQWKKFVQKVTAVQMKNIGTKTVLFNRLGGQTWSGSGQWFMTYTLYGKDGQSDSNIRTHGNRDIADIFLNDPDTQDATAKLLFGSGVLDLTIVNNSTIASGTGQNASLEVDVYEIMYSKTFDAPSALAYWEDAATNTGLINPGGIAGLQPTTRGCTPFDFSEALSNGPKILKKTKFFLGQSETATYQLRDAKTHVFNKRFIDDGDSNCVIRKITKTLLVVAKGVPTVNSATVNYNIQIGNTRKYSYKLMKENLDKDQEL